MSEYPRDSESTDPGPGAHGGETTQPVSPPPGGYAWAEPPRGAPGFPPPPSVPYGAPPPPSSAGGAYGAPGAWPPPPTPSAGGPGAPPPYALYPPAGGPGGPGSAAPGFPPPPPPPGFEGFGPGAPPPPYPPAGAPPLPPAGGAGAWRSGPPPEPLEFRVNMGRAFSEAFRLMNENLGMFVLYALCVLGIALAASLVPFGWLVVYGPLGAGYFAGALKAVRGEKVEFVDFWSVWKIGPIYLYYIVTSLLVFIGFCFCFVPGIYLAIAWLIGMPLILEYGLDFWPAAELSRRSVSKNWFSMFLFVIVAGLILIFGSVLTCFIGLLYFIPWYNIAITVIYRENFPDPRLAVPAA